MVWTLEQTTGDPAVVDEASVVPPPQPSFNLASSGVDGGDAPGTGAADQVENANEVRAVLISFKLWPIPGVHPPLSLSISLYLAHVLSL